MKKYVIVGKEHSHGKDEWWCEWFECPNCEKANIYPYARFCPECGIKLVWRKDLKLE